METRPSYSEFERLAEQGNLIPVYREFLSDTETPVSAYLKIKDKSFSYLLESADGGNKWGRYSFIGYKPYLVALSRDGEVEISKGEERKKFKDVENPLEVLRDTIKDIKPVTVRELAAFQGGLVGYMNYDLVRKWEHLPGVSPEDSGIPESLFTASKRLIIFDHLTHQIKVIAFAYLEENDDLKMLYDTACE